MERAWTAWRRLRRRLDSTNGAFEVDFSSRAAALAIFEEGVGSLLTDGSRACMAPSHLSYGVAIEGGEPGETGVRLTMDDQDVTCGHEAMIAVGHLASRAFYSYGDFEWRGRVHHAPGGGVPPANAFTCFSTFIHGSLTHNELAWCFPAHDGNEVHMSCTHAYACFFSPTVRGARHALADPPTSLPCAQTGTTTGCTRRRAGWASI